MQCHLRAVRLASAILAFFAIGAASAAGLPVTKKLLKVTNARIEFSFEYPRTGNSAIDATLLAFVHQQLDADKGYAKDPRAANGAFDFETTYTVERNDGKMFGVVFSESSYTGGAHPNDFVDTFNFLLPDGAQVFLPEIVDGPRGIQRISKLAIADLIATVGSGPEAPTTEDNITSGAGPIADNFKAFIWLPNKLHLYFPSDQVAAYVSGPQESAIPLSRLRDVIRPDWRAPAPSFDCAKAASVIEKAVCADAALARLDRQVAEAYALVVKYAYEPAAQEKVRQVQRKWLVNRNSACAGPAPGACLTKLYRDRLADLNKPLL